MPQPEYDSGRECDGKGASRKAEPTHAYTAHDPSGGISGHPGWVVFERRGKMSDSTFMLGMTMHAFIIAIPLIGIMLMLARKSR